MTGVATVTVALFLSGVVTGVIVVVALAIRREDRRYSLVREAPDRMSRSARRLTGVGRRGLDAEFFPVARELVHQLTPGTERRSSPCLSVPRPHSEPGRGSRAALFRWSFQSSLPMD